MRFRNWADVEAEQQKMFAGEDRKWRGRAEKPAERKGRPGAGNAGAKAGSPVSEEQQFEEADIPF